MEIYEILSNSPNTAIKSLILHRILYVHYLELSRELIRIELEELRLLLGNTINPHSTAANDRLRISCERFNWDGNQLVLAKRQILFDIKVQKIRDNLQDIIVEELNVER